MAERRKGRGIDDRDVTARSLVRGRVRRGTDDDAAARREREAQLRASAHARARGLS